MQAHNGVAERRALCQPRNDALDRGDVAHEHAHRRTLTREGVGPQIATRCARQHSLDDCGDEGVALDAGVGDGHDQRASPALERQRAEADHGELASEQRHHVLDGVVADVADAPAEALADRATELSGRRLTGSGKHSRKRACGNDHRAVVVAQAYLPARKVEPNRLLRVQRRVLHTRIHTTTPLHRALTSLCVLAAVLLPLREASAAKPKFATTAGAPLGPVLERPSARELPFRSCGPSVCVHARLADALAPVRRAFDDAFDLTIETLRIARPLLDGGRGGDSRLDVYLLEGTGDLAIGRDPLDRTLDRDGAPAFITIDPSTIRSGGCSLSGTAARAIVRASAAGVDVAETPLVVDGLARRIGELACPSVDPGFAELQAKPFRALTASPAGTTVFARTLDLQYGQGYGAIVPAVLSMAVNHRGVIVPTVDDELGPVHFHNDVTVFDVLATTLSDAASSLDAVLLDVATARALHPIAPAWEFVVPASTLPRRFAIRRGIEPMGSTFIKIELDSTPANDAIELDLSWDMGARFVWHVLKLDAAGKKIGEIPVPPLETTRKITVDVRRLAGVRSIVLEGVNTGDPLRPFHPDEPLSHARGYELGVFPGS